jgi:hypothetical protein
VTEESLNALELMSMQQRMEHDDQLSYASMIINIHSLPSLELRNNILKYLSIILLHPNIAKRDAKVLTKHSAHSFEHTKWCN